MARGALRGAATAWLGLVILQTVTTTGAGRVSGLIASVDALVKRALDPTVPAIPDRAHPIGGTTTAASTAGGAAMGAAAARAAAAALNHTYTSSGLYSPPVSVLPIPGQPAPS